MSRSSLRSWLIVALFVSGLYAISGENDGPLRISRPAYGCLGGGGGGAGGAGGGANGVIVDADGVLRVLSAPDNGQLLRQRMLAAQAKLGAKVTTPSKLRKISLNRLEAACKAQLGKQAPLTEEMIHLAGLTRVSYVFYYPDTKDIVIAGPSEGWVDDALGRAVGMQSGRIICELQDLIVALRAFPAVNGGVKKSPVLLVSIDPTPEGLANMQNFLRSIGSHATPADTDMIVTGLRSNLGMQNIRVSGISPSTHFAQVMIEADYRMKLIGIGIERPPVQMSSYVDKANPSQSRRNALQRWYFVPDYKCVRVAPDDLGMELVGDGVKLVGEDQLVASDGNRKVSGKADHASQVFVTGFTQKYGQIAARLPVYAQLRNLVDMAVAAAFIQQHDYYGKAGWNMEVFGNEKSVPVENLNTPLHVESVCTSIWKGNHLMTPIGGGVTLQPRQALDSSNLLRDDDGKVSELREKIQLNALAPGQWWWD